MDRKDIIFGGVSNVPDDSIVDDGQLSLSVNAIKHGGSIQPIESGTPETYDAGGDITINKNERLEYVHHLPDTGEERYIVLHSNILVDGIQLSAQDVTVKVGETSILTADVHPSDATNGGVTWKSNDTGIATVLDGVITGESVGDCIITCTASDGSGVSATCRVHVLQPVTLIGIPESLTLTEGGECEIEAVVSPHNASNKSLTWSSSDESVATVNQQGVVSALSAGECSITCTASDGSGVSSTCVVTVVQTETEVRLSRSRIEINVGETEKLTATVRSISGDIGVVITPTLIWSSSDQEIASVIDGEVYGEASGDCIITCTADNGSGAYAQCQVRVKQPATGISVTPNNLVMKIGDTQTLIPSITPEDADNKSVVWSTSDPRVAIVDSSGKVTAIDEGSCTITAETDDGSNLTTTCSVSVSYEDFVDLGLPSGTLWATKNVGAGTSTDTGRYVSWAETEEKEEYLWPDYRWGNGITGTISKYNTQDGLEELDAEDDVATAILGDNWCTPTRAQLLELTRGGYTTVTPTQRRGLSGYLITSLTNGNSIFLPSSGEKEGSIVEGAGTYGKYWSSTLNYGSNTSINDSCILYLYGNGGGMSHASRYTGLCVRPVYSGSASQRPRRRKANQVDVTFTLIDELDKVELIGRLDEGRTMSIELTYHDETTDVFVKEVVSCSFTKEDIYMLPVHQNTAERILVSAKLISYDDSSITPNVVWRINSIGNIVDNGNGEYGQETVVVGDYAGGAIGSYTLYPEEMLEQVRIESVSVFTESILASGSGLSISWFNKKDGTRKEIAKIYSAVREITSIKNVLIVSTNAGLYFARNIGEDGYQWLGALPELPCVTPYLTKEVRTETKNVKALELGNRIDLTNYEEKIQLGEAYTPPNKMREDIYKKVIAYYDGLQKDIARDGLFSFPFWVRVAYRMFDGTYLTVSNPYPMCPTDKFNGDILTSEIISGDEGQPGGETPVVSADGFIFTVYAPAYKLSLKIGGEIPSEWKDIITGFDIFVSPEVADYTKDDSGEPVKYIYFSKDITTDRTFLEHLSSGYSMLEGDLRKKTYNIDSYDSEAVEDIEDESISLAANETIELDDYDPSSGYVVFYAIPKADVSETDITYSTESDTTGVVDFKWYMRDESDFTDGCPKPGTSQWKQQYDYGYYTPEIKEELMGLEETANRKALTQYFTEQGQDINDYYICFGRKSLLQRGRRNGSIERCNDFGRVVRIDSLTTSVACAVRKITMPYKLLKPRATKLSTTTIHNEETYWVTKGFNGDDITSGINVLAVPIKDKSKVFLESFNFVSNGAAADYRWLQSHGWMEEGDMFYDAIKELLGAEADAYAFFPQYLIRQGTGEYENVLNNLMIKSYRGDVQVTQIRVLYNNGNDLGNSTPFGSGYGIGGFIHLERTTGESALNEFKRNGDFFRIDSVNFEDIRDKSDYTPDLKGKQVLATKDTYMLTSEAVLDTSVINRYAFNCNDIYAYNNRLNVVVDSQELEIPDYADNLYMGVNEDVTRREEVIHYAVEVVKEGITRIVPVPKTSECKTYADALRYFFYPNQNATRLLEYIEDGETYEDNINIELDTVTTAGGYTQTSMDNEPIILTSRCKLKKEVINSYSLTKHEGIYGSVAFSDWKLLEPYKVQEKIIGLEIGKATYADGTDTPEFDAATNAAIYAAIIEALGTTSPFSMVDTDSLPFTEEEIESGDALTATITAGADVDGFNILVSRILSGYQKKFHVGNKILQSDVENPFAFLNGSVVQLGCETIHRVCAASRPISEGQKGKHPLYAFTDEGIFALAVNSVGEYEKADLVSPEVITSNNVHQVEQSVLFATSKGLMSISENDLVCLSSKIEGHNHAEGLKALQAVKEAAGLEYVGTLGFHAKDWFATSELVYDSKHGFLYIFQENPILADGSVNINLGLVYDVESGVFGMYENRLLYGVNSYTDALGVEMVEDANGKYNGRGRLVNMSMPYGRDTETPELYHSLLVTRPMQFGEKDAYKTMEDIILRGAQGTDKGMLVIWASNDLEHWKIIGSSTTYKWRNYSGTPYKYFRIGVLMNGWKEGDSITGISIDTTTRLTNKLR